MRREGKVAARAMNKIGRNTPCHRRQHQSRRTLEPLQRWPSSAQSRAAFPWLRQPPYLRVGRRPGLVLLLPAVVVLVLGDVSTRSVVTFHSRTSVPHSARERHASHAPLKRIIMTRATAPMHKRERGALLTTCAHLSAILAHPIEHSSQCARASCSLFRPHIPYWTCGQV